MRWTPLKKYLEVVLKKKKHKNHSRPLTDAEKEYLDKILEKEKRRYEQSKLCGGIDSNGNYTALHHRNWD